MRRSLLPYLSALTGYNPACYRGACVAPGTIWFLEPILPLASSQASRHVSLNPNRRPGPLNASYKEASWSRGPEHAFLDLRIIEQTPPWQMRR